MLLPFAPNQARIALRAPSGIRSLGLSEQMQDRLAWLCTTISTRSFDASAAGFVPLSSRILDRYLGRGVVDQFIEAGWIDCDGKYCAGEKCLGYKLGPGIAGQPFATFIPSAKFAARVATQNQKHLGAVREKMPPGARCVIDYLKRFTLADTAWDHLEEIDWVARTDEKDADPQQARESVTALCLSIRDRQFYCTFPNPKTGRVYHSVANLPRDLRAFGRLDGQCCAEIDICSSQPYFLASFHPNKESAEYGRYVTAVRDGVFYEMLAEAAGFPGDRDRIKTAVLTEILFGKCYYNGKTRQAFAYLFPMLAAWISRTKESDYKTLSLILQRREAEVVLGEVVPRLANEFPGVPFLPIHDSIMMPVERRQGFLRVMHKAIEEATGIGVCLKVN